MNLRRVILVTIVMALLVSPVGAAAGPSMLRVGLHSDESTLTPYSYVRGDPGYYLLLFIYDTLLLLDADNMPQPGLAENSTWSSDGRVVTLDLRKDVKWHDGRPFTAEDVVFTFEYVLTYVHNRWTGPVKVVEKVEAVGQHQVVITLKQASVGFIYQPLADMPILPKHIWEGVTDPNIFDGRVGTGPYKLVDYQADQYYRFEANKDYFLGAPSVDELVMPIIKDATAMFAALKAGEVDAVSRQLSAELVEDFSAMPQLEVVNGPVTLTYLLLMNNRVAPFDNKDFRKAIYLAIDKQNMLDTLFLGYATAGSPGWVHPALPWYLQELDNEPRYNLDEAKRILEELNYRDLSGDGFRQSPDGTTLAFTLLAPSDDPIRVRAAEILASEYLKDLGLKVTVLVLDRNTLFARIGWSGTDYDFVQPRNFELLMWGWSAPIQSWPGRLRDVFHSDHKNVGTLNIQSYGNPALDPILEEIHFTTDSDRRNSLAQQAQRIIAADAPFVSLYHPDGIYVYNKNAYDGWVFAKGLGIFQKLSFVSGTAQTQAGARDKGFLWVTIVVLLAAAAVVVISARWRRQARAG